MARMSGRVKPGRGREDKSVWLRTTKGGADLQPVVHPQGVYGGFSARDARMKRQAKSKRLTRMKRNTRRGVTSGQARNNRGRKRVIESATARR